MAFVAVLGLVLTLAIGVLQPAVAKTLRLSFDLPLSHLVGENLVAFKNDVERATNGQISIKIYSAAALYKDREVADAVSSGAIEMGAMLLPRLAESAPVADLFSIPFLFASPQAAKAAAGPSSSIRRDIDRAILATGARPLWWQATGRSLLLAQEPILKPETLKGKTVQTFGRVSESLVRNQAGKPVSLSTTDQYIAYHRRTIDAAFTVGTSSISRRLYEVAKVLTLVELDEVKFVVLMNEGVWQSLSAFECTAIEQASTRAERAIDLETERREAEAIDFLRRKLTLIQPTPDQLGPWRDVTDEAIADYIRRAGSNGQELVAAAQALR